MEFIKNAVSYLWNWIYIKPWGKTAYLDRYAIISKKCPENEGLFETCIYSLGSNKKLIDSYRIRYIAVDEEQATRWHYIAIGQAIEMEQGKKLSELFNWQSSNIFK